MYDEYDDDNTLEFWDIKMCFSRYPLARGVMYAKPTADTVLARVHFPRLEPFPELRQGDRDRLSAMCANKRQMRNIVAEVKEIIKNPDGGLTFELVLYRKGTTPE